MTPEAKLASAAWRRANSWWICVPLLSLGFLSWLGWLIAAIRTQKRSYWVATCVYALLFAAFMTLVSIDSGRNGLLSDLAMIPFLAAWIVPTVHSAIKNREYLTTIAYKGAWYTQVQAPTTEQDEPNEFLGVSKDDLVAPGRPNATVLSGQPAPPSHSVASSSASSVPAARVDVNRATAAQLAEAVRIDHDLAARVIVARDARGGFRDLDDLATGASLQPHQLIRFRNRVSFGSDAIREDYQRPPSSGRILDY